jgi:hypothetical protein
MCTRRCFLESSKLLNVSQAGLRLGELPKNEARSHVYPDFDTRGRATVSQILARLKPSSSLKHQTIIALCIASLARRSCSNTRRPVLGRSASSPSDCSTGSWPLPGSSLFQATPVSIRFGIHLRIRTATSKRCGTITDSDETLVKGQYTTNHAKRPHRNLPRSKYSRIPYPYRDQLHSTGCFGYQKDIRR